MKQIKYLLIVTMYNKKAPVEKKYLITATSVTKALDKFDKKRPLKITHSIEVTALNEIELIK